MLVSELLRASILRGGCSAWSVSEQLSASKIHNKISDIISEHGLSSTYGHNQPKTGHPVRNHEVSIIVYNFKMQEL